MMVRRTTVWLPAVASICAGLAACKPPAAVQAVDDWLVAYEKGDTEVMLASTVTADRALLGAALVELRDVPTGTLAMALPPRPSAHEIVEVESKDEAAKRWVVLTVTTLKNPLPFMSKKVGQLMEDMPKTRDQRRRFLVVEEGGRWGVKLDLERVVARQTFIVRFQQALDRGRLDEARGMLASVPPPPDEANALKKTDRLRDALQAELEKAAKHPVVKTATATSTATPPP